MLCNYCLKVLEDMLKHVPFHLKTDHKNLVYMNCVMTGKVAQWKLYMQDFAIQLTYELLYVHLNLYTVRTSDVSCKLSIITYLTSQLDP